MWNLIDLEPPVLKKCKYERDEQNIDLNALKIIVNMRKQFNDEHLKMETGLLERILHVSQYKFRNYKSLKAGQILLKQLMLLPKMNYPRILKMFYDELPAKYEPVVFMPTLNMLDFVLVKTQGVAKLLAKICDIILHAIEHIYLQMRTGFNLRFIIFLQAIFSRIFVICKHLLSKCFLIYNHLYALRSLFKNIAVQWLQDDYELPADLESWIDAKWFNFNLEEARRSFDIEFQAAVNAEKAVHSKQSVRDIEYLSTFEQFNYHPNIEVDDMESQHIEITKQKNKINITEKAKETMATCIKEVGQCDDEDIGTAYTPEIPFAAKRNIIMNINSIKNFDQFLTDQSKRGDDFLFSHLPKDKWLQLHGRCKKELKISENKKQPLKSLKKCKKLLTFALS